jgi:hypothetical protein
MTEGAPVVRAGLIQVERGVDDVVTGGRVVGGSADVVAGARVLVVAVVGDPGVLGALPSPLLSRYASVITTTTAIALTAAATSSHARRDLSSSSSVVSATRAPQWGQNLAPGASGSSHIRQRSVAPTIRRPVLSDALTRVQPSSSATNVAASQPRRRARHRSRELNRGQRTRLKNRQNLIRRRNRRARRASSTPWSTSGDGTRRAVVSARTCGSMRPS